MALKSNRWWIGTAVVAGVSVMSVPASADGRGHYGRHHGRDHVSTGDVIAGIMVIGAIAAIASEAGGSGSGQRDYPERNADPAPTGYRATGMDRAVDMCVAEVERRSGRVEDVDSANRGADGWFISGTTTDDRAWTCRIGADGRAATVEVGDDYRAGRDTAPPQGLAAGQYDDAYYASARAALGTVPYTPLAGEEQLAAVTD